jgi:hypothetical protein
LDQVALTLPTPQPPYYYPVDESLSPSFDKSLHALLSTEAYLTRSDSKYLEWVTEPKVFFGVEMMNPSLTGDVSIKLETSVSYLNLNHRDCMETDDADLNVIEFRDKSLMLVHWFELDMDDESVLTTAPICLSTQE